jgi:choline dehydrogenase-like flavoprotein
VFDYERDIDGVYIRRRFSFSQEYQREHGLPNVVSWLGNWELPDARHGYGQLSSKVTLTSETDRLGRRKLAVDLRFIKEDVDGIIRAHKHWDRYFRTRGVGQLEYQHDDLEQAVDQRMGGGFHQAGTTRMSVSPADGVVDQNLAVHGVSNVYVASSSTFVTSGQANSTFMIVAFTVRLADHLARQLRP